MGSHITTFLVSLFFLYSTIANDLYGTRNVSDATAGAAITSRKFKSSTKRRSMQMPILLGQTNKENDLKSI